MASLTSDDWWALCTPLWTSIGGTDGPVLGFERASWHGKHTTPILVGAHGPSLVCCTPFRCFLPILPNIFLPTPWVLLNYPAFHHLCNCLPFTSICWIQDSNMPPVLCCLRGLSPPRGEGNSCLATWVGGRRRWKAQVKETHFYIQLRSRRRKKNWSFSTLSHTAVHSVMPYHFLTINYPRRLRITIGLIFFWDI